MKDYCKKNGNVCRYSSEKKEYEFYDTKKLKEYEGYLKLSGLKDSVKIVNRRKEYEYAKESRKYKDDRATANKEQIRLGEALARFNYAQLYQTYIFQGGEKDLNAFEASEGFKFRENKFISDIKNSGVEFGGKYELYDGNSYITSLKSYEDLARFSGVASKNGIKLTMSEVYTSALLTQHDPRPLKIDIKGSAIAGEEVTVVAGAVMSRNQLDKMPKYGKPKNKVETERTEQKGNKNNDYYNSKSKQLEYGKSIEEKAKDTYHKTPATFDLEMIKEKPALIRNDGRVEYLKKGYINGKEGVFHITVRNGNKVIHKNFIEQKDWKRYMEKYELLDYNQIK
ncbi:hypothetical protein EII29_11035 [Leptotrichia sp. OH3620_COT-345]|uniref:hypothetical protein n=1 Tax=Leptotrichia sp. OH3620_COT-345 TaxID=2491048 RepID=UPI000F646920|nr:hypothetical protein [Leptotrichia sp. OH3620_COT-345]RRD37705.1 hypothetical protein EII29_11035 [Leptotrichia sp. OH3620_COT-345]